MASTQLSPLHHNVPIVDPETGNPTPFFQQMIQQLLNEKGVTDDLADGAIQPGTVTTSGLTAAAQRLLGNKESTSGAIEELTLSQALDLIGSAAQGDLLFRGASGWQRLAAGTSGQFLKTLGAGVNPAWDTPSGGGGGGLTPLSTKTASSSASLAFTSLISATYDEYVIELIDVLVATNTASLTLQVSTDNGATWSATGYQYSGQQISSAGSSALVSSSSASSIVVMSSLSNMSGWGCSGTIRLFAPGSSSRKQCLIDTVGLKSDSNWYRDTRGGLWANTSAYTAFRLIASSGNIASGVARLYGVAH